MDFKICEKNSGKTTLFFLKKDLGLSAKVITSLKKKDDGIMCNKKRVTVRYVLNKGDILSLNTDDSSSSKNIIPKEFPLEIIFEDESILVVNKPPYMPTHPSHGHFDDTLANAVCFHIIKKSPEKPFVFRPINRLDRNTSGLVLIAKNKVCAGKLQEAMQKGLIQKKYIAVLNGNIIPQKSSIETGIRRKTESIIFREVCDISENGSDYALTEYETLSSTQDTCAILASPITGRTHQLRVHFAHKGCAILGDDLYGQASDKINRQALHAVYLSFPHPITSEQLTFVAPLPSDIKNILPENRKGLLQ